MAKRQAGAIVAAALATFTAMSAQAQTTSYGNQQLWHAVEPNTASSGVAFSCMTDLHVSIDDADGRTHTGPALGPAIVMPVNGTDGGLYLLTVPTNLILSIEEAYQASREGGRSFIGIPNTDLALETTNNRVTVRVGSLGGSPRLIVDPFFGNVLNGNAIFSQPGEESTSGAVTVAAGARAFNPNPAHVARALGEFYNVQTARFASADQQFTALPVQACSGDLRSFRAGATTRRRIDDSAWDFRPANPDTSFNPPGRDLPPNDRLITPRELERFRDQIFPR